MEDGVSTRSGRAAPISGSWASTLAAVKGWNNDAWHGFALFNGTVGTLTMIGAVVLTIVLARDLSAQLPSRVRDVAVQVTSPTTRAAQPSKSSRSATSCSSASRSTPTPRTSRASSRSIGMHIVRRSTVGDDAAQIATRRRRSARSHRRRHHHGRPRSDVRRSHQAVDRRRCSAAACTSTKSISRGWKSGGARGSIVRCRRRTASRP